MDTATGWVLGVGVGGGGLVVGLGLLGEVSVYEGGYLGACG